ncbi:DUF1462 family protein [Salisediminibacterium halotolerans]|uniref:DUF1462 family protein n=1 Tax=Salisediminibacterium halotolerans TaxID=517425 RepID=UPI000EB05649|nr:DUF1462 family protein [Salisediminibacterium halotolerans]RLJ75388.1 disulfide oxidoreductase YuzD [Actinophytocola xinjiangensis]RPE89242.1 disulfide oxidoreductase YuzD [Salisediminibacterium halotolerans]TWG36001.1 disulfide oxidoreductase YuzD [Salisediminibacterium halotolerans]GEL07794.1 putative disulfide oxidoreductase YuzD [Salisediminibacterium halotolerans]
MRTVISVYGAEEKCASCIHLPSAIETKEWLEAALNRKFPDAAIEYRYCDIQFPQTEEDRYYARKIQADEYFYPLVVLNGRVVAEGDPHLPDIAKEVAALADVAAE